MANPSKQIPIAPGATAIDLVFIEAACAMAQELQALQTLLANQIAQQEAQKTSFVKQLEEHMIVRQDLTTQLHEARAQVEAACSMAQEPQGLKTLFMLRRVGLMLLLAWMAGVIYAT